MTLVCPCTFALFFLVAFVTCVGSINLEGIANVTLCIVVYYYYHSFLYSISLSMRQSVLSAPDYSIDTVSELTRRSVSHL